MTHENDYFACISDELNDFITNNKIETVMQRAFYSMNNGEIKEIESIIRMVRK